MKTIKRNPSTAALLLAVIGGMTNLVHAQVAPAAPPPADRPTATAPREEVVELSPFVVATDRDTGWIASSTLIGNRTNQELANVPVSIDAITSEFMEDLGAYTMEEAAEFIGNIVITDQLETQIAEGRVTYRGIVKPDTARLISNSSRNFFPSYVQTDNYNVERLDFNKGSNSLMFGDASPGGLTTVYTKRPRDRNFGKLTALYGSFDTHRVMLDVNRKLTDKLAARINLVDRSTGTYIDFYENHLQAADIAVTYRPFKNTAIRVEGEAGRFEMSRASNLVRIRANSAPGRGFVTNNRWYYTSDGEIVRRTSSSPAAVDRLGVSGSTVTFLEGQAQTITLMNRVGSTNVPSGETLTLQGFDKSVNLVGANDHQDRPFTNFTAWIEQKFGDLYIEAAFNQQSQQQERNDGRFPTTVNIDRDGRPYLDSSFSDKVFGNRAKIGRLSASYPWRVGQWMEQFVVVNGEWQQNFLWNIRQSLANLAVLDTTPAANLRNNQITVRAYLDDPAFPTRAFWEQFRPENLPVSDTFRPGLYDITDPNLPFYEQVYQRTFSASAAGSYFGGRFRSLLGVRRDAIKRKLITDLPRDVNGRDINLGIPDAAPEAYSYDPRQDLSNTSYTGGLVYQLREGLNVYGVYSESFNWQRAVDFTNTTIGPIVGDTKELGIKSSLFEKRLNVTIAGYEIERRNAAYEWSPNRLTAVELEDLFNPNDLQPGDPGYFAVATGFQDEANTATSIERSRGWEATLQLARYKGVQARLTFSHNELEIARDMSKFRAFYDAARERTDAALAPGGNPAMAEDPTFLADAEEILASNEGLSVATGGRSSPYSVSWLVDYEFPRGSVLKGTRVAAYGRWQEDYNIISGGTVYRNGGMHPIGMYAIHRRKIAGYDTTFRLGLKNIVDLENSGEFRPGGISRLDAAGNPEYWYRYLPPTTFDLTVTLGF